MGLTDYTFGDKRIWQAGREYEQERIIKLLESNPEEWEIGNGFQAGYEYAIALIKGEK